jgi:hypothetical protein
MSAPKPYDDALVEQLVVGAYVPAAADWKWLDETDIECEEESGVRAVLDRLVELGWQPPAPPMPPRWRKVTWCIPPGPGQGDAIERIRAIALAAQK